MRFGSIMNLILFSSSCYLRLFSSLLGNYGYLCPDLLVFRGLHMRAFVSFIFFIFLVSDVIFITIIFLRFFIIIIFGCSTSLLVWL